MFKLKTILVLFILIFSFSISSVTSKKILENDKWIYVDQYNNEYNESAISEIHLTHGASIALIEVETTRPYIFDMTLNGTFDGHNIFSNVTLHYQKLFLTQEGGIPYLVDNITYFGFVIVDGNVFNSSEYIPYYSYSGDPSITFITTTDTQYRIAYGFKNNNTAFNVYKTLLFSSKSNQDDKIKNYTISQTSDYGFDFYYNDTIIDYSHKNELNLNAISQAMSLSYNENYTMPVYISQTEPVNIKGLSLDQIETTRLMEYTLKIAKPISQNTETTKTPFYFILPFVLVPVFIRRLRKNF